MPCVYILFSQKKNQFYTGSSREDVPDLRVKRHNAALVRFTKSGVPWNVIHVEFFPDYTTARKRELFLKTGVGPQWVKTNFPQD